MRRAEQVAGSIEAKVAQTGASVGAVAEVVEVVQYFFFPLTIGLAGQFEHGSLRERSALSSRAVKIASGSKISPP